MYISKTKQYQSLISLTEVKEHLKLDVSDSSSDAEILRLIRTAIILAEKHCQVDLVPTVNVLEDYCVWGYCYDVYESNVTISGITGTTDNVSTAVTAYEVKKYNSYTRIVFDSCINVEKLQITYSSGASTLSADQVHAIKIKVAELFDIDRNGHTSNAVTASKAFERLLAPYVNHLA